MLKVNKEVPTWLVKPSTAAEQLGISKDALLRHFRAGHIPAVHFSARTFRFRPADLEILKEHIQANGSLERPKRNIPIIRAGVYFLHSVELGLIKIGLSRNLPKRISSIKQGCPVELELIATIETLAFARAESWFHSRFKDQRRRFEWFAVSPEDAKTAIEDWKKLQ